MTLLRFTEREVWRKTPYQLTTLFKIHKEFHPDRFKPDPPPGIDPIDIALGGL